MEEEADSSWDRSPEPPRAEVLSWREWLAGDNELERYAAVLGILGEQQADFLRRFPELPAAEGERVLAALWQQAEVLLLEGRERAGPIFALACSASPAGGPREAWRQLVTFFRPAKDAPLSAEAVALAIEAFPADYHPIFARALLIHPSAEVRGWARGVVEPAEAWQAICSGGTSLRVLGEIWSWLLSLGPQRVPDGYYKVFLTVVARRLLAELPREQVGVAARFLLAMLETRALGERSSLQLLTRIEKHLRAEALRHGADLLADAGYRQRVEAFAAVVAEAPLVAEQPITIWPAVPLAVQRILAKRGLFLRHFCSHAVDAVALECFPHLMRREDTVEFLKILTINARLIAQLAEEKQLYESDSAKFFLIANPRCPYHIIGKYLGYLSSESLTKLTQGYLFNNFARKQAERLLEQRGKAKKPIPTKASLRRPQ